MHRIFSPIDGSDYVERELASSAEIDLALNRARAAQQAWKRTSITERAKVLTAFCDIFASQRVLDNLRLQRSKAGKAEVALQ